MAFNFDELDTYIVYITLITIFVNIFIGLLFVNWVIVYYRLLTKGNETAIINRFPNATLLIGISGSLYAIIEAPYSVIWYYYITNPKYTGLLILANKWMTQILLLSSGWLVFYRLFVIYYQLKYCEAIDHLSWLQFITKNEKKNFFIKHKNTLGNPKYVAIFLVISYGLLHSFWIYIALTEGIHTWSRDLLQGPENTIVYITLALPVIFICTLVCFYPNYTDTFHIKREAKVFFWTYIMCNIIAVVIKSVVASTGEYSYIISQYLSLGIEFAILYSVYQYVFNRLKLPWNMCLLKKYIKNSDNVTHVIVGSYSGDNNTLSFKEGIQNSELLSLFAKHLNSEFGIENLLFLLEMSQYKQQILKYYQTIEIKNNIINDIVFCNTIHVSCINETIKPDDIESVKLTAIKLIAKYINDTTQMPDFLINISFASKTTLYELFDVNTCLLNNNINIDQLYALFDDIGYEIYKITKPTWRRFITIYNEKHNITTPKRNDTVSV